MLIDWKGKRGYVVYFPFFCMRQSLLVPECRRSTPERALTGATWSSSTTRTAWTAWRAP